MWYRVLLSAVLLCVCGYIITKAVSIHDVSNIIINFPHKIFIELLGISFVISLLKTWRFLILLKNSKIEVNFIEVLKSFLAAQAVSPLPGGEAMRGVLLSHETGAAVLKTAGPIITQAYIELFTCSFLTLIGSFVYKQFRLPAFVLTLFILIYGWILLTPAVLKKIATLCRRIKRAKPFITTLLKSRNDIRANFYDDDTGLPDKVLIRASMISLCTSFLGGLLIFLISRAYLLNLGIVRSTFIYTTSQTIQGIGTLTPGGIGFMESGMIGLLMFSGINLSGSLAIVIVFRIITLLFNMATGLIFLIIFYGKSFLLEKYFRFKD